MEAAAASLEALLLDLEVDLLLFFGDRVGECLCVSWKSDFSDCLREGADESEAVYLIAERKISKITLLMR